LVKKLLPSRGGAVPSKQMNLSGNDTIPIRIKFIFSAR